jgi:hypothetical protein
MIRHKPLNGPCEQCRAQCFAFGWNDVLRRNTQRLRFCCSAACADAIQERDNGLRNPTPHEIDAMTDAGVKAGAFLEARKKTDLAKLSHDEWMTFIETVCSGFLDGMKTRANMQMMKVGSV